MKLCGWNKEVVQIRSLGEFRKFPPPNIFLPVWIGWVWKGLSLYSSSPVPYLAHKFGFLHVSEPAILRGISCRRGKTDGQSGLFLGKSNLRCRFTLVFCRQQG